ncbi:MAG: hypothetical protein QOH57_4228 [Mycobacterium sp.]|jgi:hypothetical protein|nr:hypothetical protein [Mycobacterium sp.]
MTERPDDPTDHARTSVPRAGEAMKDKRGLGGYALLGIGVVCIAICLGAAAMGAAGWAIGAGIAAVVAVGGGSVWVYLQRRRVARTARENALGG